MASFKEINLEYVVAEVRALLLTLTLALTLTLTTDPSPSPNLEYVVAEVTGHATSNCALGRGCYS